jgi:glycosyltransferase 2 family protein
MMAARFIFLFCTITRTSLLNLPHMVPAFQTTGLEVSADDNAKNGGTARRGRLSAGRRRYIDKARAFEANAVGQVGHIKSMPRSERAPQCRNSMCSGKEVTRLSFPTEFPATTPSSWRRGLMVGVRALVAVVIFGFIFHSVNLASITARLNATTAWAFAVGVLLLFGQLGLCTARWRLLVEPARSRPGFADSYLAFLEGQFLNQALPSTIGGDAWRVARWRAAGVSLPAAAASVFVDRLSGAMGAAILAVIASMVLSRHGADARLTLPIFFLCALAIGGIATFIFTIRRCGFLFKHFARIQAAITNLQGSLVLDRRYVASLGYSIAGHCVCGIAVYLTARSLGVDLSLVLIVSVTIAVLLIIMIPISLAGWGIREASFITLLAPFGVNSQDALLIGILYGLMNLVSALPGGLSFLVDRKSVHHDGDRTLHSP